MKKSKKGFTLAELLIVVAIIAVLTAIAVPLFVGALNDSEGNVKAANIRAVRGAAVVKILEAKAPATSVTADPDGIYTNTNTSGLEGAAATPATWELKGPWVFEAYVSASGDIVGLKCIEKGTVTKSDACVDASTAGNKANSKYKYYVTVKINSISDAAVSAS